MRQEISVFLVEDHPIFRKGLAQIIDNEENLSVCGEAENYLDALDKIKKQKPDFIVVDITLKDSSGIDLVKDIKLFLPEARVLVLSMHDEKVYAERVLRAGAKGYLMKQEAPETVIMAINQVLEGKIYLSDEMSSRMLSKMVEGHSPLEESPGTILTDRELEIFTLIGRGSSTRDIAGQLHVSIKTVENHRAHIKEKLGLANSIELLQKATLWVQENE
ncbi:MAG: response regulator transcription factor [bacterium]|nr:response regulator transcription factor [bacterium]